MTRILLFVLIGVICLVDAIEVKNIDYITLLQTKDTSGQSSDIPVPLRKHTHHSAEYNRRKPLRDFMIEFIVLTIFILLVRYVICR